MLLDRRNAMPIQRGERDLAPPNRAPPPLLPRSARVAGAAPTPRARHRRCPLPRACHRRRPLAPCPSPAPPPPPARSATPPSRALLHHRLARPARRCSPPPGVPPPESLPPRPTCAATSPEFHLLGDWILTGRAMTCSRRLVGDSAAINYIRLSSLPPSNDHLAECYGVSSLKYQNAEKAMAEEDPLQKIQNEAILECQNLGLTGTEVVNAAATFVKVPAQMSMLLALPKSLRREYVLKILADEAKKN